MPVYMQDLEATLLSLSNKHASCVLARRYTVDLNEREVNRLGTKPSVKAICTFTMNQQNLVPKFNELDEYILNEVYDQLTNTGTIHPGNTGLVGYYLKLLFSKENRLVVEYLLNPKRVDIFRFPGIAIHVSYDHDTQKIVYHISALLGRKQVTLLEDFDDKDGITCDDSTRSLIKKLYHSATALDRSPNLSIAQRRAMIFELFDRYSPITVTKN